MKTFYNQLFLVPAIMLGIIFGAHFSVQGQGSNLGFTVKYEPDYYTYSGGKSVFVWSVTNNSSKTGLSHFIIQNFCLPTTSLVAENSSDINNWDNANKVSVSLDDGSTTACQEQFAGTKFLKFNGSIPGATVNYYRITLNGKYTPVAGYSIIKIGNGQGRTNATSCEILSTSVPQVSLPTSLQVSTSTVSVCKGSSTTLSATYTEGVTYKWYKNDEVISGQTGPSITVSEAGTYRVTCAIDACNNFNQDFTVTVKDPPSFELKTSSLCLNATLSLSSLITSGSTSGEWNITGGTASISGGVLTATTLNTITLSYTVTDGPCTTTKETTVTVKTIPTVTSALGDARCGEGTVTLTASASAGTLNWYSGATGGESLGTGTSFTTPSISETTKYYVDATNNSCISARTEVTATVKTIPTVTSALGDARCGEGTVTLTASASAGTLNWYSGATGGESLGTGTSFTTPSISETTKYYVDATNNSCISARTEVTATVKTIPTVTSALGDARCGEGTVTLTASASAGTLNWYSGATGGESLGTGTSFTTPSISETTKYYVDATNNSCISARTEVTATVKTIPTVTSALGDARCGEGTVTLTASASAGTLNWYSGATGGESLGTGTSFTTPSISETTKYYVDATNNSCISARTEVTATVKTIPTVTSALGDARCGEGTVTLTASASAGTLNWYSGATGGESLGTGTSFTTPSISETTKYYVDATNNSCISARTEVTATVKTIPTVTSALGDARCGEGTVTLTASASAGTLNWYSGATGGESLGTGTSFTTPSISETTKYYVDATNNSCISARTEVTATVKTIPTVTSALGDARCGEGTVTLTASASAGTLNWYSGATGGESLGTGTSFTTPSISETTKYYVDATNNSCISARTEVTATVKTIPTVTSALGDARCGEGTVTLTASASAGTLNWYSGATGGESLGTGTSFTTPSISETTKYYVDATNNSCISARTEVTATVKTIPTVTSALGDARCGEGTVTLTASASAGTLNWYSGATGGESLGTGTSFTTPSISETTKYYVDATNNSCISARTEVTATVKTIPTVTSALGDARCGEGTVTLTASASAGTLNWYSGATGGESLGTGTSFTTPSISETTKYYVDATNNSCISARTEVTATVKTIPTVTSALGDARCGEGTVTLTASASAGTLNWYSGATGGESLGTGTSFTTPSISETTKYYVDATNNSCISARTEVTATVKTIPTIQISGTTSICKSTSTKLTASGASAYLWSNSATVASITVTPTETTTYTVTGTSNGCSKTESVTVIVTECAVPMATYTQGFYGNTGGKTCDGSTTASLLTTSFRDLSKMEFGSKDKGNYFTLYVSDIAANIYKMLPGGGTPAALKGSWSWATKSTSKNSPIDFTSGKIVNNLLSQTITLWFNIRTPDSNLGGFVLPNSFTTAKVNCGDNSINMNDQKTFNVTNALVGKSVDQLFELANKALGGGLVSGDPSLNDIYTTIDLINNAFDQGRAVVSSVRNNSTTVIKTNNINTMSISAAIPRPQVDVINAYPNPFTDKLRIVITAKASGHASLAIYDASGLKVADMFDGELSLGEERTFEFFAPSGRGVQTYIYHFVQGDQVIQGKLLSL